MRHDVSHTLKYDMFEFDIIVCIHVKISQYVPL